jgi:hypothetical protein
MARDMLIVRVTFCAVLRLFSLVTLLYLSSQPYETLESLVSCNNSFTFFTELGYIE